MNRIKQKNQPKIKSSHSKRSSNSEHPAFCFNKLNHLHNLDKCEKLDQIAFAKKIVSLGSMTWAEIQSSNRHGVGHEKINQNSIQPSLPEDTPNDRNFLAFRLGGGKHKVIIGYRIGKLFYVVWIDTKGKIYRH